MPKSSEHPDLEFRSPRSWTRGRLRPVSVIVIHTTEGHEHTRAAEDGAAYDGRRTDGTSAHYFVDPDSAVQCVLTKDTAHTARRRGNQIGIQYELCGKAGQTKVQWNDPASTAILRRAAKIAARDAKRYGIPVRRLTPGDVRAGRKGFCGHVDITKAFPEDRGTHTDPGQYFPWTLFLGLVAAELGTKPAPPPYPGTPVNRGDSGGRVKQVQARLDRHGHEVANDGVFGAKTESAVKAFQRKKGLTADGVVGPKTWKALWS